jgi:hypothetical protein
MTDSIVARTVQGFCQAYGVSRSKAFELLAQGKLERRKVGARTLIPEDSARKWFDSTFLPMSKARTSMDVGGPPRTRRYQRSSKYREKQRFPG